eukprot:6173090-Pleurochrysis_carterae.AAC.1
MVMMADAPKEGKQDEGHHATFSHICVDWLTSPAAHDFAAALFLFLHALSSLPSLARSRASAPVHTGQQALFAIPRTSYSPVVAQSSLSPGVSRARYPLQNASTHTVGDRMQASTRLNAFSPQPKHRASPNQGKVPGQRLVRPL